VSFLETIRRAKSFLEEQGRVSLRALQREFELDGDALEELVEELVDVQQIAAREGKVLAWIRPPAAEPASSTEQLQAGERSRRPGSRRLAKGQQWT
jgi:hypothetical protein